MSNTYSIACLQCRKHLWIGQGRIKSAVPELRLYGGGWHDQALRAFLAEHVDHPLVFGDNCSEPIIDFDEIEEPDEPRLSDQIEPPDDPRFESPENS